MYVLGCSSPFNNFVFPPDPLILWVMLTSCLYLVSWELCKGNTFLRGVSFALTLLSYLQHSRHQMCGARPHHSTSSKFVTPTGCPTWNFIQFWHCLPGDNIRWHRLGLSPTRLPPSTPLSFFLPPSLPLLSPRLSLFLSFSPVLSFSLFLFLSLSPSSMQDLFPNQGSNPCPLLWKHGVLTTGPPGKFLLPHYIFFKFLNFLDLKKIYLWLCWIFIAARGLSLVVANGGFSLQWFLLLWAQALGCSDFSSCSSGVLACGLRSCGSWA